MVYKIKLDYNIFTACNFFKNCPTFSTGAYGSSGGNEAPWGFIYDKFIDFLNASMQSLHLGLSFKFHLFRLKDNYSQFSGDKKDH